MERDIIKHAILNALLTIIYIAIIASFLFYAPKIFAPAKDNTVFIPIVMLSLFVFSAALTGILIFGRPVLWYLDGHKKEAISLLAHTLIIFLIITIIAVLILYLAV
jgi:hypothetical protein